MNKRRCVALFIAGLLSACGGGGGDQAVDAPATSGPKAEGLWVGSTSTDRSITGLVLETGDYWVLYSSPNNSGVVAGVVQGNYAATASTLESSDGKDFNMEGAGITAVTVRGSFNPKATFNGQINYPNASGTVTFSSSYQATYEKPASLADITGTFTGVSASSGETEGASLSISSTGNITGTDASGCAFTGTAKPRAKSAVYDLNVTFKGGVCVSGTNTLTGIGYFDATNRRLFGAGANQGRTSGFMFIGQKAANVATPPTTSPTTPSPIVTSPGFGGTSVNVGSGGCGSRGGPGYRLASGRCASWADYYAGRR
jgi:hypothetical protein